MLARIWLPLALFFLALAGAIARADPDDEMGRHDASRDGYASFGERRSIGGERVKPAEATGDAWVSARVAAALLMDDELAISDMQVATHKGRVQLSGVVHSDQEAQAAERIAWRVEGVHAVVNSLSVQPALSAQTR
ncbi:MAG TPA: BON domain-containing protein [Burkholderiales bacterium]|nr:BON domain-containing protein [Burkholderiales bacterium]